MESITKDYYALYDELYHLLGSLSLTTHLFERMIARKNEILIEIDNASATDTVNAKAFAEKIQSEKIRLQKSKVRYLENDIIESKHHISFQSQKADLKNYEQRELARYKRKLSTQEKKLLALLSSLRILEEHDLDHTPYLKRQWALEDELSKVEAQAAEYENQLDILKLSLETLETKHDIIVENKDGTYKNAGEAATAYLAKRSQQAATQLKDTLGKLDADIRTEFSQLTMGSLIDAQKRYQVLFKKHYRQCNVQRLNVLHSLCVDQSMTDIKKDYERDQEKRQKAIKQAKDSSARNTAKTLRQERREKLQAHFASIEQQYSTYPKKTAPIRLTYSDSPDDYIRNTHVICWQYAGDTEMPTVYSQSPAIEYSVFHAKTDEEGFLHGIRNFMRAPKDANSKYVTYSVENNALHAIAAHKKLSKAITHNEDDTRLYYLLDNDHLLTLDIGTRYGFMTVPNEGEFKTDNLISLADGTHKNTPTSGPVATIHTIKERTTDYQEAALFCTLPGWTVRIRNHINDIRHWQKKFSDSMSHKVRDLSCITEMQQSADMNFRFPADQIDDDELKERRELTLALDNIKEHIESQLESPDQFHDNEHKAYEREMNRVARRLLALLNSKELETEFLRYQEHAVVAIQTLVADDDETDHPGPDMLLETQWQDFFFTLRDALGILGTTSMKASVEETWIKPILEYVGTEGVNSDISVGDFGHILSLDPKLESLYSPTVRDFSDYQSRRYRDEQSLATSIMGAWNVLGENKALADTFFHRLPGPPSLLMIVLDVYGAYVSRYLYRNQGSSPSFNSRFLINGLGYLMGKNFLNERTVMVRHLLVRNLYFHTMAGNFNFSIRIRQEILVAVKTSQVYIEKILDNRSAANAFYDRLQDGLGSNSLKRIAIGYSSAVTLLGLTAKVSALQGLADLEEQLKEDPTNQLPLLTGLNIILGAASASANTYSFIVNRTASGARLHQRITSLARISLTQGGLSNFCDRFAHMLGYFAAVESAFLAEEAFKQARYETASKQLLNSLSLVGLTLGSQLLARGGVTMVAAFIPGIGIALLCTSIAIQVVVVTWDYWIDKLKHASQLRYSKAYNTLLTSPYIGEYTGKFQWQRIEYPELHRPIQLLAEHNQYSGPFGIWDDLSWHAVIPLYLEHRKNGLSTPELLETLSEFVDLEEHQLSALVQYYEHQENALKNEPMKTLPNGIHVQSMLAALAAGDYSPHPENHLDDVLDDPTFRTFATAQGPKTKA